MVSIIVSVNLEVFMCALFLIFFRSLFPLIKGKRPGCFTPTFQRHSSPRYLILLRKTAAYTSERPAWPTTDYMSNPSVRSVVCCDGDVGNINLYLGDADWCMPCKHNTVCLPSELCMGLRGPSAVMQIPLFVASPCSAAGSFFSGWGYVLLLRRLCLHFSCVQFHSGCAMLLHIGCA